MASYIAEAGEFTRDTKYIETRITADGRDGYPVQPDRYRLVVARACPWANRAIIVRRLLGLEHVLSIGFCGPTHDERSWTCDLDPAASIRSCRFRASRMRTSRAFPTTRRASPSRRSSMCRRGRS